MTTLGTVLLNGCPHPAARRRSYGHSPERRPGPGGRGPESSPVGAPPARYQRRRGTLRSTNRSFHPSRTHVRQSQRSYRDFADGRPGAHRGGILRRRLERRGVQFSAELYDPFTGNFTSTSPMTGPRAGHVAAPLPGGRALLARQQLHAMGRRKCLTQSTLSFSATGGLTNPSRANASPHFFRTARSWWQAAPTAKTLRLASRRPRRSSTIPPRAASRPAAAWAPRGSSSQRRRCWTEGSWWRAEAARAALV